jgi:uncharacterized delta-60 repeat protein
MKLLCKLWAAALALCLGASAQAQGPQLDPSFLPASVVEPYAGGLAAIGDMVLQPDGKLIVTGSFREINGRAVRRVARLLPDGQVDLTFNVPPIDSLVDCIALQADGRVLLGGRFITVGGQSRIGIARLLADGSLDPTFLSPFGGGPTPTFAFSSVQKIVLQPGRGILALGVMVPINPAFGNGFYAARLLEATGALDPSFQPNFDTYYCNDVLVQPNGHLVFAGSPRLLNGRPCHVWGTLPDGTLDPAFVPLPGPNTYSRAITLTRELATGNIYVVADNPGGNITREPRRLLPNGTPDPTFSTANTFTPASWGGVGMVVVQPNGRLLLSGDFLGAGGNFYGSVRLLPSGALDPSYEPSNGPRAGVGKILVQPDGALLFAGYFQEVAGLPITCLARMLDPNVLSARARAATENDLVAWPVPAREVLHLRLPAARPPRELTLLDALGRVVRQQAVPASQRTPDLLTAGLPPGGYLLRVRFADGPPAYRRVVLE